MTTTRPPKLDSFGRNEDDRKTHFPCPIEGCIKVTIYTYYGYKPRKKTKHAPIAFSFFQTHMLGGEPLTLQDANRLLLCTAQPTVTQSGYRKLPVSWRRLFSHHACYCMELTWKKKKKKDSSTLISKSQNLTNATVPHNQLINQFQTHKNKTQRTETALHAPDCPNTQGPEGCTACHRRTAHRRHFGSRTHSIWHDTMTQHGHTQGRPGQGDGVGGEGGGALMTSGNFSKQK